MGGALHSISLCDEQTVGFEGLHILRWKFTYAPELSAKPILNDIYKKFPAAVTLKLRKPHIEQVRDGRFGACVRFLGTNFAAKMFQRDDILASFVRRPICIIFPKKRKFAMDQEEVGEERGIYLTQPPNTMRENVFTPAVRRDFVQYWANFTKEPLCIGARR